MANIKEKIEEMNTLINRRSNMKPSLKIYRKTNSRIQAIRRYLKKHNSLPELKQTKEQPLLTNFIAALPVPNFADMLLQEAIKAAAIDQLKECKSLLLSYDLIKKAK